MILLSELLTANCAAGVSPAGVLSCWSLTTSPGEARPTTDTPITTPTRQMVTKAASMKRVGAFIELPNDKDHRPRAAGAQHETEASSRGSVHPLVRRCVLHLSKVPLHVAECRTIL